MQDFYTQRARAKAVATCLALIVIAGLVLVADHLKGGTAMSLQSSGSTATTTPATASTAPSGSTTGISSGSTPSSAPGTSAASSGYKDGTYTATAEYYVPRGYEAIQVSLTVKNGVITDSTIANSEGDPESARFQENFAAAYKSYVVGKSLAGLQLSHVAGASDTTSGFNDAVSQIASKATA